MHRIAFVTLIALSTTATAQDATPREGDPPWRASALGFVPQGYVAGAAYRTDGTTGYLALYPVGADDPKTPASVFTSRRVLVVKLAADKAVSAELKPRDDIARGNRDATQTDQDGMEEEFDKLHAALAGKRAKLPPGAEPCDLGAWSEDKDVNGLNVRAEPSAASRVLGTLPPPYRLKISGSENGPDGGYFTEFRIIGFKDGWFLIEGAKPPGKDYEDEKKYPRNAPKPYPGRGWVAASKVGASFANGSTRAGGLFQAPHVDAKWTAQRQPDGALEVGGGPKRIFACSGHWGLVESRDGIRGWWRGLCSNQVTNCS